MFVIHVWFLFMYGSCLCNFVVEKNSLKVIAPENLRDTYECAIGDFGVPRCGGALSGLVVYPTFNQLACNNFTDHIPLISKKPGSLPVFLLADRGGNNNTLINHIMLYHFLFFFMIICFLNFQIVTSR